MLLSGMIGQIDRQFLLILALAVVGISSRQGVGEKDSGSQVAGTEDSLNKNIPEKGIGMEEEMCEIKDSLNIGKEEEMCKIFDPASQLGFHGDLGFDNWHLVREEEREGKCPGTREKVETHLASDFHLKYKYRKYNFTENTI